MYSVIQRGVCSDMSAITLKNKLVRTFSSNVIKLYYVAVMSSAQSSVYSIHITLYIIH